MFASIYRPPGSSVPLAAIAEQFSPRYECHRDDLVSLDVNGVARLFGDGHAIAGEIRRTARTYQVQVQVAIAATRVAALVLAQARPGLTVVPEGGEQAMLAPLPVHALEYAVTGETAPSGPASPIAPLIDVLKRWGIRTLGDLAALPAADLSARLGQDALAWQAIARGEDAGPLVPTVPDERFEAALQLEWPIDSLEPLSFVLTRLLEPLIVRLERRDRGAAAIATMLRLVTRETCTRRIELPTPLRDLRTLRTLVLLDLEAHPAPAAIDAVTIVIEPTPGRVLQHTLFTRPTPTPEQLSTLLARLHALLGQERVGAPAVVDTYRPGAFAMRAFATEHDARGGSRDRGESGSRGRHGADEQRSDSAISAISAVAFSNEPSTDSAVAFQAVRRCRQPVPARVAVEDGRPVRVTTDRRGYPGGRVARASGPWSVSGEWWDPAAYRRDEWDVELADGTVYRVFRDDFSDRWFVDAIVD